MLSIELGQEKKPTYCSCCGGQINSVYGFIFKDGNAYAVYHATWSVAHPEAGVDIAIDFDDWGKSEGLENRWSVGLLVRTTELEYQFQFRSPENSAWGKSEERGRMLSREEALSHPQKDEFLHVADHIVFEDPRIKTAFRST